MAEHQIRSSYRPPRHPGPHPPRCDRRGRRAPVDVRLPRGALRRTLHCSQSLGAGEVRLHGGTSGDQKFFVAWGFVEVLPERVTILAETALHPNEIDVSRGPAGASPKARSSGTKPATTARSTTKPTPLPARPRRRSPLPKAEAPRPQNHLSGVLLQRILFRFPVSQTRKAASLLRRPYFLWSATSGSLPGLRL